MQSPKYQSLKDHVYEYIAQKIQDGTLLPNQKVNEAEICKKLDISRTPTREALFQLSSDNLLDYLPRRGFTVKAFDSKKNSIFPELLECWMHSLLPCALIYFSSLTSSKWKGLSTKLILILASCISPIIIWTNTTSMIFI